MDVYMNVGTWAQTQLFHYLLSPYMRVIEKNMVIKENISTSVLWGNGPSDEVLVDWTLKLLCGPSRVSSEARGTSLNC